MFIINDYDEILLNNISSLIIGDDRIRFDYSWWENNLKWLNLEN